MSAPFIQTSFAKGEIAPSLYGHVDLALFHTAASTMRNMFVGYRGGSYSRAGTAYVNRSKQRPDLGQLPPRLVPFQFNITQGYALEFGDNYLRFISQGGLVLEPSFSITAATQQVGCTISVPGNNFANGDWVTVNNCLGMTQLNGNTYIVAGNNGTTFFLQDLDGNYIDSTNFGAYTGGGTAARVYTLATPYAAVDLPLLKFAESADVMSLTHPNYPPQELSRLGPTTWTLQPAGFGATIQAPASASASATVQPSGATSPPTLPCAYAYVVTAIDPKTGQESIASPIANVTNSVDMAVTAGSVIITWASVPGAQNYNIRKAPASYNTQPGNANLALPVPVGAQFGLIGSAFGTQFVDSNLTADFTNTPPQHKNPFAPGQIVSVTMGASSADWTTATATIASATGGGFIGQCVIVNKQIVAVIVVQSGQSYLASDAISFAGDGTSASATLNVGPHTGTYPGVVSYFQQRRVYAGTLNNPDTYFMSQPGAFLNFDSSIPTVDSDAITGTPWSEQVNGIQWMVSMPLGDVTFTGNGVWQVGASGSFASNPQAITPASQIATPQSSIGSSATVPPVRINWNILYLQSKGSTVRELSYQIFLNLYTGLDISWSSSHLFQGHSIVQWAWCEEPYRVLWAVRDDGILLSLTYVKEQEVVGWARHDTQGRVRSVCAVTEAPVDALYMVVERFLPSGSTRFFLERMDNRLWQSVEDTWAVDAAVALPLPTPNATLFASTGAGNAVFQTAPAVFTPSHVGQVIRMGGGIVQVTGYAGPGLVSGTWLYPCQQLVPNDPTGLPLPQLPNKWSIAPQVTTLSGLMHLAGKQVVGLADGVPTGALIVSAQGTVTLPYPASRAVIGLGYTAQLQSVYLDTGQPTIQGRRKAISAVTVRTEASAGMQAGANQDDAAAQSPPALFKSWLGLSNLPALGASLPPTYATAGGATVQPLYTGDMRIPIPSDWKTPGQVAVQQSLPLPLNVLGFVTEMLPGDEPEIALSQRRQGGESRADRRQAA